MTKLTQSEQDTLDAAAFRRLLKHLDDNKDVQNIDLMILSGFCRNCLSKWYKAAADAQGIEIDIDDARARIYGMDYQDWKSEYQPKATPEQIRAFEARSRC